MGTRWRGLLAPINKPTGDGRRMKAGAFTHRQLPLALKWQRLDDAGHDASVVIGMMDTCDINEVSGEVWGAGELFDDQAQLPRLSQDVAEAMLLTEKKVIGPSVDAGAAEAVLVEAGSDVPLTEERLNELWIEAEATGVDPDIELLFTSYEIAAATLVVIPAFAEARPFELLAAPAEETSATPAPAALVASLTAAAAVFPGEWFEDPQLTAVTPITVTDDGRVFGHAAQFGVCHVGIPNVCTVAPHSQTDYALFHRYPIDTTNGLEAAGRLTTGHGRVGTGCSCCPGKDDHACDDFSLTQAIDHYDRLETLAWIRAGEDEHGIWIAGALATSLSPSARRVLSRQTVSGDWRMVGDSYELVEVLALAKATPGFPLSVKLKGGRQMSLTAAGAVRPNQKPAIAPYVLDHRRLARDVADLVIAELRPAAVTAADGAHTGAMVALVPTAADAARLAVEGGEPADKLHATRAYLGEGADWSEDDQYALIAALQPVAAGMAPVTADGFSLSLFNPDSEDKQTCVVLGLSGEEIASAQDTVMAALEPFADRMPDQHAPHLEHLTLEYTDNHDRVAELVDRVGPVTFDRLRIAFGGVVTDLPLGGSVQADAASTAAALLAEVEASAAAADPETRIRVQEAAELLKELETVDV